MKHKAQESLKSKCNKCEEMARITHRGGCAFRNIDNTRCKEYDTLQDLINCQLTLEEMKFAANCLYAAGFVDENMVKQILGKFQKQKEMWVSEDE